MSFNVLQLLVGRDDVGDNSYADMRLPLSKGALLLTFDFEVLGGDD